MGDEGMLSHGAAAGSYGRELVAAAREGVRGNEGRSSERAATKSSVGRARAVVDGVVDVDDDVPGGVARAGWRKEEPERKPGALMLLESWCKVTLRSVCRLFCIQIVTDFNSLFYFHACVNQKWGDVGMDGQTRTCQIPSPVSRAAREWDGTSRGRAVLVS